MAERYVRVDDISFVLFWSTYDYMKTINNSCFVAMSAVTGGALGLTQLKTRFVTFFHIVPSKLIHFLHRAPKYSNSLKKTSKNWARL